VKRVRNIRYEFNAVLQHTVAVLETGVCVRTLNEQETVPHYTYVYTCVVFVKLSERKWAEFSVHYQILSALFIPIYNHSQLFFIISHNYWSMDRKQSNKLIPMTTGLYKQS
jgi:hypothetical protein